MRLPTKPFTGERISVELSVIFSSSSRACACMNCALASSSWACDAWCRASASSSVWRGSSSPLEQAARAIEAGLGELEIGFTLLDGGPRHLERGLGLVHLFLDLAGLDPREQRTLGDAIADAHDDVLEPAVHLARDLDRRLALEAADDRHEIGHRAARGRCELDGQRRAGQGRARGRGAGLAGAAPDDPGDAGQDRDGDEEEDDLLHDGASGPRAARRCRARQRHQRREQRPAARENGAIGARRQRGALAAASFCSWYRFTLIR